MPWAVGVDEAGYGPNLGPLVQVAAAVRLPWHDLAGWETLRPIVRRAGGRWGRDARLVIDDSKRVYHGPNALGRLAHGVHGWFGLGRPTLHDVLARFGGDGCTADAAEEPWFVPHEELTSEATRPDFESVGAAVGVAAANVVQVPRFNRTVEAAGSKAAVLADGLVSLLRAVATAAGDDEPMHVLCDKQGGRTYYGPLLREAFPDAFVCPDLEKAEESRYRVEGLGRTFTVTFRPKADAEGVAVAVASMLAKYLREVCMGQFNAYWRTHLPDLSPTAGYPGDARRFYDAIRPVMDNLGVAEASVWRVK